MIDLGVSVHGKLKLIPKLNEYGNPIRKLFYYGRKDLEMAYKQMSSKLLGAEILMDANSLSNIVDKVKHLFIFDSKLGKTNMVIVNPERVSNVGEIVENCTLYIKITGKTENESTYYLCSNAQGKSY